MDKADRIKDLDQYTIESKERFLEALMQAKSIYDDESSSQLFRNKSNCKRSFRKIKFLLDVLKRTKSFFNQVDCSQEEIDNCCVELENAINRLVKKEVDVVIFEGTSSINTGDSNIGKEYFILLVISCLGLMIKKEEY